MNRILTWQLALRYLRGKRSNNAVPILSRISMVAIAVSCAAMIVIFSVFNGIEALVKEGYTAFYPEIKISAARGKFFKMDERTLAAIAKTEGVLQASRCIEDNALVNNYNNAEQKIITLKGIDRNYMNVTGIRSFVIQGTDSIAAGPGGNAIAGKRILDELGVDVNNVFSNIEVYYLNPDVTNPEANPMDAYQSVKLHPTGSFMVQDQFDGQYVLAPLASAQQLFKAGEQYSSIELRTEPEKTDETIDRLKKLLGSTYKVESRYEQNKTMYSIIGGEKWAIFAILVMVLLIASFNMIGALSMLVLEKQKDIAMLKAMGAQDGDIRRIFFTEGILWSAVGGLSGILLGAGIALAQQHFGFLKMGTSFVVDAYPVKMKLSDIALVAGTILSVGFLVSLLPAMRAARAVDAGLKST